FIQFPKHININVIQQLNLLFVVNIIIVLKNLIGLVSKLKEKILNKLTTLVIMEYVPRFSFLSFNLKQLF
ncbi:hypothetical protein Mgra_00006619, partial [Meloidogyne graminicola]